MNIRPRNELMKAFRESISIQEDAMVVNYEDVMKAFFDSSSDKEASYKIIERVKQELGNSYVELIFSNKDNPEELVKLISTAVKSIAGEPIDLDAPETTEGPDVDIPEDTAGEEQSSESAATNPDVGISVSTSNEAG